MDLATLLPLIVKTSILLTVLGIGLHASWDDALFLFRRPPLLIRSLLSMSIVMPIVAAALVVAFDLPPTVKVALVALSVSPVPPILPKRELKAGGHSSYAIGLLVAMAVLSVVTVPLAVSWFTSAYDRSGQIAPFVVAKIVLMTVLVPLTLGIAIHQWLPAWAEKVATPVAMVGNVLLMFSVLALVYAFWRPIGALFGNGTVLIIAAMALVGLMVGHVLGGPEPANRTVLALSTTARHPAVALAVAVASGAESRSVLAAILLYVIVATVVTIPYVAWRKRGLMAAGAASS